MHNLTNVSKVKTWWSPVWRGLVVDPGAKHYRKMRGAVWLFIYFLIHADRGTGQLRRKYATVSADMGVSARTIRRWQERLRRNGYVTVVRTGHSNVIHIRRWKSFQAKPKPANYDTEMGQTRAT